MSDLLFENMMTDVSLKLIKSAFKLYLYVITQSLQALDVIKFTSTGITRVLLE